MNNLDHARSGAFKASDAASYDGVADDFALLAHRYTQPIAEAVIALADISQGSAVLDVGCGTGIISLLAAQRVGPLGRVVGIDLSDGMLAEAAALARAQEFGVRVAFVQGDAENMQFADRSFQSVISLYALRHFPDPARALAEMYRCSVPNAMTVVAVGSAAPLFSKGFFASALRAFHVGALRLQGRGPLYATRFLDELIERQLGRSDDDDDAAWTHGVRRYARPVAALMRSVGFSQIRSTWISHSSIIDSTQAFWTLQATLSSTARKRLQAASPDLVGDLRSAFDAACGRHLARGGQLIYKLGAQITMARRPNA